MPNKYQETIAEITRARKRIKTAHKTLDKSEAVLGKSVKLLLEGPSYRRSAIPAVKLEEIAQAKEQIKGARKTLRHSETVLNLSAVLLRQSGVRPYRKRKNLPKKTVAIN